MPVWVLKNSHRYTTLFLSVGMCVYISDLFLCYMFVCAYVCACMHSVPLEARRGWQVPPVSHWTGVLGTNSGPLQEHQALWAAAPSHLSSPRHLFLPAVALVSYTTAIWLSKSRSWLQITELSSNLPVFLNVLQLMSSGERGSVLFRGSVPGRVTML